MGGYIGARAGSLSTTTAAEVQDLTVTDTTPEVTIVNSTHEDTDGGREGKVTFKGQQSGGEESTLAQIQSSHDGTADDQKGDLIFKTNDGSDGASPTEVMRLDSSGNVGIGTSSPSDLLELSGDTAQPAIRLTDADVSGLYHRIFTPTNTGLSISADTGNVANDSFLRFDVDGSERMRIDSSGDVIVKSGNKLQLNRADDARSMKLFTDNDASHIQTTNDPIILDAASGRIRFDIASSEKMRIDSSGNLLVGKTTTSFSTAGSRLTPDGGGQFVVSGGACVEMNRLSSDGNLMLFQKDGSTVGSIGSITGGIYISDTDTGLRFDSVGTDNILPCGATGGLRDNIIDLGVAAARFDDIFATNASIQTSDEREKQDIASLTSAEITAATAISKLFKTFKWKDKVAAKGDNARTHTGVVAQQVQTAMSDAGLDASKYAFFCSDTWWEKDVEVAAVTAVKPKDAVYDDDGKLVSEAVEAVEAKDAYTRTDQYYTKDEAPDGATERTRLGVRYPELLAFIGAATEQRLTSIESRLTALEG